MDPVPAQEMEWGSREYLQQDFAGPHWSYGGSDKPSVTIAWSCGTSLSRLMQVGGQFLTLKGMQPRDPYPSFRSCHTVDDPSIRTISTNPSPLHLRK